MSLPRAQLARRLMDDFAQRTGLDALEPPRRYLWTDAFAVCTDLALHRRTGDVRHLDRARRLVDQVHRVLGRHRSDDGRVGWISGLGEEEGAEHPTAGGLRIGKALPERGPAEPRDPGVEWERDGQYYHYLTRWMHALARVAQVTREGVYLRWAVDLAKAAHTGFTYRSGAEGPLRIHWKMSIDLSRPLVESQGAHDPLDGFVTYRTLQATAGAGDAGLGREAAELGRACRGRSWVTDDALGAGGLLLNLHRMHRLGPQGLEEDTAAWVERLATDALSSLEAWDRRSRLEAPAARRLAFRELGLALGLEAVADLLDEEQESATAVTGPGREDGPRAEEGVDPPRSLEALRGWIHRARTVEAFWSDPAHQAGSTWMEHRDINEVMLAASLVPDGYLGG